VKKIVQKLLKFFVHTAVEPLDKRAKDGKVGLNDYLSLVSGVLVGVFLVFLVLLCGIFYSLVIYPSEWFGKKIRDVLNLKGV
jgi:hypothetical protein